MFFCLKELSKTQLYILRITYFVREYNVIIRLIDIKIFFLWSFYGSRTLVLLRPFTCTWCKTLMMNLYWMLCECSIISIIINWSAIFTRIMSFYYLIHVRQVIGLCIISPIEKKTKNFSIRSFATWWYVVSVWCTHLY